ncbi:hypothetical protein [Blastococcus sp. CCUG 61487]|uniref:hypothetical protein n=1 Tax=Blastococcus sp. CCUG 61487 TaxID=1840703 RepID=UPI0010C07C96|nr:hypothetical protein [Blastococcus sp. CCUG 61487]
MIPASAGTQSSRPPAAAVLAAVLAMLSALAPGLFFLIAFGFSGGSPSGQEVLVLLVPLVLALGLVVGAVLLLIGRSWLVVAAAGAVLGLMIIGGTVFGGWADGAAGIGLAMGLLPAVAAVLAALPAVRGWVAARRPAR